jgi:serine/threonine protein kinase
LPIAEDDIKQYLIGIAKGIGCLHSKNIVHRNLKPQNILIDTEMKVKISDAGLACILDLINVNPKVKNYESPEMYQGLACGKPVDIWALGCILYGLCNLEVIFNLTKVESF